MRPRSCGSPPAPTSSSARRHSWRRTWSRRRAARRAGGGGDDYEEAWPRLAYVLVRGPARVVEEAAAHAGALRLLRARYPQYGRMALDDPAAHPVVRIQPTRIVVWRAAG